MQYFAANIWPEFFQFIREAIPENQESERGCISSPGPIFLWMVNIGNARRHGIAKRFGDVKSLSPGIRACHKKAVDRVIGPVREAASSQLIVARIFMQQAWENGRGHICADAVVGKGLAIALSVGAPALSPGLWIVFRLRDGGERTVERIGGPVKHAGSCEPEFLARSKRWESLSGLHGSVVRQYFENAVVYGAGFFLQLALPNLIVSRTFILPLFRILRFIRP